MSRSMRQLGAINPITVIFTIVCLAFIFGTWLSREGSTAATEPPSEKATQLAVTVQDGTRSPIFVTPVTVEGNQYLLVQHKSNGQWMVTLCPRQPVQVEKPAAAPAHGADGF